MLPHQARGLCKKCYEFTNYCDDCGAAVHKTSHRCASCAARDRALLNFKKNFIDNHLIDTGLKINQGVM